MQIQKAALPIVVRRPVQKSAATAPCAEMEKDSSDQICLRARKPSPFPELRQHIDPQARFFTNISKVDPPAREWIHNNIHPADPKEQSLFDALGFWMARTALQEAVPDAAAKLKYEQTNLLWDGEYDPPVSYGESNLRAVGAGYSVLKMLGAYLGDEKVTSCTKSYLASAASGGPAQFRDFYDSLRAASETPLPPWSDFRSWFHQKGHPVVSSQLHSNEDGKQTIKVSQKGFSVYDDAPVGNEDDRWPIPMTVKFRDSEGLKEFKTVLGAEYTEIALPSSGKVRWAYANGGGLGKFRTDMPRAEREAVQADFDSLSPAEQLAFAVNRWRMVRNGTGHVGEFYDLVKRMPPALDKGVLDCLDMELGTHSNYVRPEHQLAYDKFQADIYRPYFESINYQLDPQATTDEQTAFYFRLPAMVNAGDPKARALVQGWSDEFKKTGVFPESNSFRLAADPEVFKKLEAMALGQGGEDLATRQKAIMALKYWPESKGPEKVVEMYLDPNSPMDDKSRTNFWFNLCWAPRGREQVLKQLQTNPDVIPDKAQLVSDKYTLAPYRPEVESLLKQGLLDPTSTTEVTEKFGRENFKTLRNLGDDIADWLATAGYSEGQSTPSQEWLIAS